MTATSSNDGEHADYLDVFDSLGHYSADFYTDTNELFRRMAFNVAIHNTDDHLRNHGMIHGGHGWRLSPVFDINPEPDLNKARVTGIYGSHDCDQEAGALSDFASVCEISANEAQRIVKEVRAAVGEWQHVARRNGVPEREVNDFTEMFEYQDAELSRAFASP